MKEERRSSVLPENKEKPRRHGDEAKDDEAPEENLQFKNQEFNVSLNLKLTKLINKIWYIL